MLAINSLIKTVLLRTIHQSSIRCYSNVLSKSGNHQVGDKVSVKRKITDEDIERFTQLSGDTNPVHLASGEQMAIVHGAFLNGLVSAVIGTRLPGPGTVVVSQNLNFPNKCYAKDEVTITVELSEHRKIIKVNFVCTVEERNKVVLYGDAKLVLSKINM